MQASHYLLMFSNYENLPCVIVEAMACGLGIISTRVGGISEHINSDRGLLIGPGNEDELYSAIEHTCLQPDLFNRESLRQYAVQHFSKKAIAAQFDSIYREALG
jgi:glycosyltransferase involved in cell wall biosynthesis